MSITEVNEHKQHSIKKRFFHPIHVYSFLFHKAQLKSTITMRKVSISDLARQGEPIFRFVAAVLGIDVVIRPSEASHIDKSHGWRSDDAERHALEHPAYDTPCSRLPKSNRQRSRCLPYVSSEGH